MRAHGESRGTSWVGYTYNSNTQEVEAGGSGVQDQPGLLRTCPTLPLSQENESMTLHVLLVPAISKAFSITLANKFQFLLGVLV